MLRRGASALVAIVAVVFGLASPLVTTAATTWQISRSPSSMGSGASTTFHIIFSNLGGPGGTDDLGCVKIAIPVGLDVSSATVTGKQAGTTWAASIGGLTTVTIKPSSGGDRLNAGSSDQVETDIVVSGLGLGSLVWTANAFESQNCTTSFNDPVILSILSPTPVPTPKPTSVPTIAPTPTPRPTASATPTPRPTSATSVPSVDTGPTRTPMPATTPGPSGIVPSPDPSRSGSPPPPGSGTTGPAKGGSTGEGSGPTAPGIAPGAAIAMPGVDGLDPQDRSVALAGLMSLSFGNVEWLVPGLVLTVPGLLIILMVLLQMVGALAWVPIARRRLGREDIPARRPSPRGGRPV